LQALKVDVPAVKVTALSGLFDIVLVWGVRKISRVYNAAAMSENASDNNRSTEELLDITRLLLVICNVK
jgi:hypothetical protein